MAIAVTSHKSGPSRIGDVFELALGIGAGVVGLAGLAYFLFAPRIPIGTVSSICLDGSMAGPLGCAPQNSRTTFVYQSLVSTNFSPGWIIFFSVLTLVVAAIPVATVLHVRTRASQWKWAVVVFVALMVVSMSMLDDSLRLTSVLTLLQSGISLLPGVVLAFATGVLVLTRRSKQPGQAHFTS